MVWDQKKGKIDSIHSLLYQFINRKFMFHCARCKKSLKRVQNRPGGIEIKFFNCSMVNLWSFMFKNDEPILLSPFDVYVECQIWCICRPYLNPGELGLSDIIQSGNQCLKRSLEIKLRDLFFMIAFLFKRSFVTCAGMTKGVRRNDEGSAQEWRRECRNDEGSAQEFFN